MRKVLASTAIALLALVVTAGSAEAKSSNGTFDAFVGEEDAPSVARASNGDTVEILFEGEFDAASKTASGEGSFVDRAQDGTEIAHGTFEATRLVAFQFYGCGTIEGEEIPPDFCGGRAVIDIAYAAHPAQDPSLTFEGVGQMEINCQIGNPPPGTSEGATIRVRNNGNFNEHVSGENLFVQQ